MNKVQAAPTPLTASAESRLTRGLPADVLAQSCKRIGIMATVFGSMWVVAILMNDVVRHFLTRGDMGMGGLELAWPMPGNLIAGLGIAISAVVVWFARMRGQDRENLLRIGLAFQIVTACLVSYLLNFKPAIGTSGVSWLCLIILLYPSIVPSTPRTTVLAGLVVASMDPLWLWVAHLRGETFTHDPFVLTWHFLPTYISVALAAVPAKIIIGLGRQVNKARELGAYQLGELIGRGGMGEVYQARHRFLARPAAIKLIRPESLTGAGGGGVAIQRFRREAQAAASLRSPHTISLYDFGVTDDNVFYYVMELLEGVDFETLVRRFGPAPAGRTVFLLRHACHSLGEAHARGLVHRDIKPSNIHACRLGLNVDFVKVLDFGLVKTKFGNSHEDTLLTSPDVTTGTPAFMAPEMALGEATVDHRVDIYALGCVGYWLLTGRLVFEADTAVKMMLQHIQAEPLAPSRATELEVPPELDAILLDCLAKDPAKRPSSVLEVARRLDEVPLREPWTKERMEAWWERHIPAAAPVTALRQDTPLATMHVNIAETREGVVVP